MLCLFIGEDTPAKDLQLKKIRDSFLKKNLEQFNLDLLYSKDLTLKDLQEKLRYLPIGNTKRIIVVREARELKEEIKEFLLKYALKPNNAVILILDMARVEKKDGFVNRIARYAKIIRFRETERADTFALSRMIESGSAALALELLNKLLKQGEKPERVIGGLRYAWEKGAATPRQVIKKRLSLLLNCDIEIKTGRLKAPFALEKLVIGLCLAGKPFH
jgi:DNA polymerase III delta subunit